MEQPLQCGFAREVITPPFDIPLDGMGHNEDRVPNVVTEDITATAVALFDGEKTVLLGTLDVLWIHRFFFEEAAERIEERCGIPKENVFLCATHTHSAPDMRNVADSRVSAYLSILYDKLTETAKEAVRDLVPCSLFAGRCRTDGLNSVRRYFLENGGFFTVGSTDPARKVLCETGGDHSLQLIRFARTPKKDVVLANFAAHPGCGEDLHTLHPSFIGAFRRGFETEDRHLAFFQGAQGNMECWSGIEKTEDGAKEKGYEEIGRRLAADAEALLPSLEPVAAGEIRMIRKLVPAAVDHTLDALAEKAKELLGTYRANVPLPAEIVEKYGLHAATQCRTVIKNATEYKDAADLPVPLSALSFGRIAFVFAGYEMFTQSGMQIKAQSPFAMTFICGNSCGSCGYMPASECFGNHGFEVNSTTFVRGTAEMLAEEALSMLGELRKESVSDR